MRRWPILPSASATRTSPASRAPSAPSTANRPALFAMKATNAPRPAQSHWRAPHVSRRHSESAASRAAGVLHVGPYEGLGLAFQKLGAVIAARNLFSHVEGMIAVYHDAPGRNRTRTSTHTRPSSRPLGSRQISKVSSISIWSAANTPSCSTMALTRRWAVRTNGCTASGCRSPAKSRGTHRRSNCTSTIPHHAAGSTAHRRAPAVGVNGMRKVLAFVLIAVVSRILAACAIPLLFFTGADHSVYDEPRPVPDTQAAESDEHRRIAQQIAGAASGDASSDRAAFLQRMRAEMDAAGTQASIASTVTPVSAGGVPGEWVIAPNAAPGRRVLYIHGGGYMMGSPRSHRLVTSRMSEAARAAVLSIDYRLIPEHRRMAGIEDCRATYRWLLANGLDGPSPPAALIVAGD